MQIMKIKGVVYETIRTSKNVEVFMEPMDPDDPNFEIEVEEALREKAMQRTIETLGFNAHGWEIDESEGVEVEFTKPLRSTVNNSKVRKAIVAAFLEWVKNEWTPSDPIDKVNKGTVMGVYEHDQWFVQHTPSGASWSVVDAEGGPSVDGFDFEQIADGDND